MKNKKDKHMNIVAIIPARGESKRIPRKNVLPFAGIPLIAHSILHASGARLVDRVYVTTDDEEIKKVAEHYGASVIDRPKEFSGDRSTSEDALKHALGVIKENDSINPDYVVFLQCTSPLREDDDIDNAIEKIRNGKADSLFSVCRNHGLIWAKKGDNLTALNYDSQNRKMEQDMDEQYRENGSIYIFKPDVLEKHNNRFAPNNTIYEMSFVNSFQVDTEDDVKIVNLLLGSRKPIIKKEVPENIGLIVFDFDGVMTDNKVKVDEKGEESVVCNRGDGLGIDAIRKAGIPMIILSTETNEVVAHRAKKLNLECHQGIGNKKEYLEKYLKEKMIDPKRVVYVGNDVNDVPSFDVVGYVIAPRDSHREVLDKADIILSKNGGEGVVRELSDLLLKKYE